MQLTNEQNACFSWITNGLGYREYKYRVTQNLSVPKIVLDVKRKLRPGNLRLIIEPSGEFHPPAPPNPNMPQLAEWHGPLAQ